MSKPALGVADIVANILGMPTRIANAMALVVTRSLVNEWDRVSD